MPLTTETMAGTPKGYLDPPRLALTAGVVNGTPITDDDLREMAYIGNKYRDKIAPFLILNHSAARTIAAERQQPLVGEVSQWILAERDDLPNHRPGGKPKRGLALFAVGPVYDELVLSETVSKGKWRDTSLDAQGLPPYPWVDKEDVGKWCPYGLAFLGADKGEVDNHPLRQNLMVLAQDSRAAYEGTRCMTLSMRDMQSYPMAAVPAADPEKEALEQIALDADTSQPNGDEQEESPGYQAMEAAAGTETHEPLTGAAPAPGLAVARAEERAETPADEALESPGQEALERLFGIEQHPLPAGALNPTNSAARYPHAGVLAFPPQEPSKEGALMPEIQPNTPKPEEKMVTLSQTELAELQAGIRELKSIKAGVSTFREESSAALEMTLDDIIVRDVKEILKDRRPQATALFLSEHAGHLEMLRGLLREDRALKINGDDENNPKKIVCSQEDGTNKRTRTRYQLYLEQLQEMAGPVDPRLNPATSGANTLLLSQQAGEPTPEQVQKSIGTPAPTGAPEKTIALSEDAKAMLDYNYPKGMAVNLAAHKDDPVFLNKVARHLARANVAQ